jgi:hypothetical protein
VNLLDKTLDHFQVRENTLIIRENRLFFLAD